MNHRNINWKKIARQILVASYFFESFDEKLAKVCFAFDYQT